MGKPRFLADGMLGKTARWLRILGYDTVYLRSEADENLIRICSAEDRILLTSDKKLYVEAVKAGVQTLLIEGRSEAERLARIASTLNLKFEVNPDRSRCPECNSTLRRIKVEEAEAKGVPEGVLRWNRIFWACTGCGKVYWIGSHARRIKEFLLKVYTVASEHG